MTQEEKKLLLQDLSSRLPYGVIVNVKGFDYDYNDKLTQIYNGNGCSIQVTTNMPYDIEQVKPYLFPLSSMTEEQRKEFDQLIELELKVINDEIDRTQVTAFEIDFYNKHHLDWRGLIEKSLAIDATNLNIY